mmetsp:Transcript_53468/g.155892  ORF Transcript_53468/g.155892 Transcript_53468/m.155892 type:complete len:206 (-) Transcript_53468:471-1088(-)
MRFFSLMRSVPAVLVMSLMMAICLFVLLSPAFWRASIRMALEVVSNRSSCSACSVRSHSMLLETSISVATLTVARMYVKYGFLLSLTTSSKSSFRDSTRAPRSSNRLAKWTRAAQTATISTVSPKYMSIHQKHAMAEVSSDSMMNARIIWTVDLVKKAGSRPAMTLTMESTKSLISPAMRTALGCLTAMRQSFSCLRFSVQPGVS